MSTSGRDESDQPELPKTPAAEPKKKQKGPDIALRCKPKRKSALMRGAKRRGLKLSEFLLYSAEYQISPSRKLRKLLSPKDDGQLELPAVDANASQLELFATPPTEVSNG